MFIGSLTNEQAKTNIAYSYKKRGTDIIYNPNRIAEKEDKPSYDASGALFNDIIAFDGTALVDGTIDIKIELGKTCYIDQLNFVQGDNSKIGGITILADKNGKRIPVGLCEAQTDKLITDKEISIQVGIYTDNIIIRLISLYEDMAIGKLEILGATGLEDAVYPIPKNICQTGKLLTGITGISAADADAEAAAADFAERYAEKFGKTIAVGSGNISFALDTAMAEEQLEISVTEAGAAVKAGSRRALFYAGAKLLQLATEAGIKTAEIKDEPFMSFRGVHFALPARDQLDFIKRMVKYVFVPMGYNTVILQLAGAMEYKRHPEFNDAWLEACKNYEAGKWPMPAHYEFVGHDIITQEEVVDLCDYIRSFGIDLVPEVQSLAHVQYITAAYPEMGEVEKVDEVIDLYTADAKPDEFYIHSMCPNHPDYYKIIFDIMDEVIEVLKPTKYLHIGHDEVYTIGKCERCKDIPDYEIYAKEVTMLHDHLAEKGLKTMMWSDMIQEDMYTTAPAIDLVPKDILCLSFTWYFHPELDVEDDLYDHGFEVAIGNLYSSHYQRFDKRKYGKTLIGGEVSTWIPCNELYYGFEGKTYDFLYTANMLWNEESRQDMRRTYGELVNKISHDVRASISGTVMADDAKSIEFNKCPCAVPYDMHNDYCNAALIEAGKEIEVAVNAKAEKLSFLHATDKNGERIMWDRVRKIGSYIAEYEDGTTAEAEVFYAANIYKYKKLYALPIEGHLFRHEGYPATCLAEPIMGKTCEGKDYTLYNYTWVNPNPGKVIKKLTLKNVNEADTGILVFDIKAE